MANHLLHRHMFSPVYFFQGGILMTLGGLLEWVLGNSFPAVVFCSFGTFWLSYGGVLNPSFAAFSSYAGVGDDATEGLQTTGFNASLGELSHTQNSHS